jgi:hypothetical protein
MGSLKALARAEEREMEIKPDDIGEIELFSVEAHAPRFCGCHATLELGKKARGKRPKFDKVTLKKVRCKGNEVTFRILVKKEKTQI